MSLFPREMPMSLRTDHLHSLGLSFQLFSMRIRPPVLSSLLHCAHHTHVKGLYDVKNFY